jgi:uroporphyrinogen-III synthase
MEKGAGGLGGLRIAVTRGEAQAGELCVELAARGAEVVVAPLIRIVPPPDLVPLEGAARRVGQYDWVVFTSSNGVKAFSAALETVGVEVADLVGVRVACIGPGTAAAAAMAGWCPDLIPEAAVAESLLDALLRELGGGVAGEVRVLLPVAAGARTVIERGLAVAGIEVERVEAYRTECDPAAVQSLLFQLRAGVIDVLTFASPSAVDCLADAVEGGSAPSEQGAAGHESEPGPGAGWNIVLGGARVAVIGPVTAAAARRRGLEVRIEAAE